MNICTITGFMVEDPILEKDAEGVGYLNFQLVTYEYRKTKSGDKNRIPTVLKFEAWASGAETIAKLARRGTKLTVVSSARNKSKEDESVVFRVNTFDFACLGDQS
jgi:single-stranded DNA-binding protein